MGRNLNRKKLAEDATPSLSGKSVLIVGNRFFSQYYKMALEEAGAKVSFTDEFVTDFLMPTDADKICAEIAGLAQKPDIVLVFQPGMRCTQAPSFGEEPAIRVAAEANKQGVPTLILDTVSENTMGATEAEIMRRSGARYHSSLSYTPFEALPLFSQVIENKQKSSSVPTH
jgi:hypothetical protein